MNLVDIKTIYDMIVGAIPLLVSGIKAIFFGKSTISETAHKSVAELTEALNSPDKDKVEADRIRAVAELIKDMAPIAFVEYLFYVTKVASAFCLLVYFFTLTRRDSKDK